MGSRKPQVGGNSFANGPDGIPAPMRAEMRNIRVFEVNRFTLMEGDTIPA